MIEICRLNAGCTCETNGLMEQCEYEISATVNDVALQDECYEFVRFIADYISLGNIIRDDETVMYGYWLTKGFLSSDHSRMIFYEYNPEATEFVFGVDTTLLYWRDQHRTCQMAGAQFSPSRPDQLVAISEGVYEGDAVEGVRYPSPSHMSGWWLTSDKYNGDINSLKTVHAHHVTAKRPDLAKFFALPYGYRFFSSTSEVRFDEKVARS